MARGVLRRLRSSRTGRAVTARLIAGWLRLCRATGRWEVLGAAHRDSARAARRPVILAIWHGRLAMVATERAPQDRVHAMISRAGDGALIAAVMARFGIGALRGSSQDPSKPWRDRGGREALAAALAAIRVDPGAVIAISPDGPRGPRMRCQPGIALLSARTGVPVMPFAFSVRRGVTMGSWDRFLVPLPFAGGVIAWGPPIAPPGSGDAGAVEAHRAAIEAALTNLTRTADARTGRATPEPG